METVILQSSSGGYTVKAEFIFHNAKPFQNSEPNFELSSFGANNPNRKFGRSVASYLMSSILTNTENYQKYFSGLNIGFKEPNGMNCTLYFRFTLKDGYELSSEVAHLTSDGF